MTTAREWAVEVARRVASQEVRGSEALPLAAFQAHAASRLAAMVRAWGGALLADAVGLGKTRVAISVAVTMAREQRIAGARGPVWLCAPARLRASWAAAAHAGGLEQFEVVSHTAFSRGNVPDEPPIFVVVDEAHRFRNPTTRRRQTLETRGEAPMLLVTATPIANTQADLWSLLALFLDDGDVRRAFGWDLATARALAADGRWDPVELVAAVTVRRTTPPDAAGFGRRPTVALEVVGYEPGAEEAWLWTNLERSVRGLSLFGDAQDWPMGLFVEHVLRRWESGPDALLETLRELEAFAERRLSAARQGRTLDRRAFRALFGAQPQQEVFAFLYPPESAVGGDIAAMEQDVEALGQLVERARLVCRSEAGRDEALVDLARRVSQLLIFTSYRSSARGLFDRLVRDLGSRARAGLVTGDVARATGLGRTSAAEVLQRFAPRAHGVDLREHERLDVLVATDCIAEGVNLQDCGHVVLADLPYSPLGIEQRIGRLLRPGGPHEVVRAYLCRPTSWNDSLGMRRRLQTKLQTARDVGFATDTPGPFAALTVLDEIARSAEHELELPGAMKLVAEPHRWLVLAMVDERPWFFATDGSGFVAALAELVWDARVAEPCAVPDVVVEQLAAREAFLAAAMSAPAAVQLDAPEARAWRMLLAAAQHIDDLAALRTALLRHHRRAVRRQIERLIATGSAVRLARFVRTLGPPSKPPSVVLVSALGVA